MEQLLVDCCHIDSISSVWSNVIKIQCVAIAVGVNYDSYMSLAVV